MIQREVVKIENQRVQIHLDDLIKELQNCGCLPPHTWSSLRHSSHCYHVKELITALRNYNIVPDQPEPVQAKGPDVQF